MRTSTLGALGEACTTITCDLGISLLLSSLLHAVNASNTVSTLNIFTIIFFMFFLHQQRKAEKVLKKGKKHLYV
jgi:hypothetical protein